MKKLILAIICLCSAMTVYSQNAQCTSAAALPAHNSCATDTTASLEEWFTVVADSGGMRVTLQNIGGSGYSHMHYLSFYSGNCNTLTLLASDSVTTSNDTSITVAVNQLTPGNMYFIKAARKQPTQGCLKCSPSSAAFKLCVVNIDPLGFRPFLDIGGNIACPYPHASCGPAITCPQTICTNTPLSFCTHTLPPQISAPWDIHQAMCGNAYILWTFTGSNITTPQLNNASNTPIGQDVCYYPVWNTPGTYNVHVKYESACNDCATNPGGNIYEWVVPVTVTGPSLQTSSTNTSCNGGSNGTATVIATGTPPFSYLWSPSGQTTQTATGLSAGTYTVSVTDDSGCENTTTVTVGQPTKVGVSATGGFVCSGGNGQLSAAGFGGTPPYSYTWSPTTGLSNPNISNPIVLNPTSSTVYTVTVTDANGCTGTNAATITVVPPLNIAISGSISSCQVPSTYCVTLPNNGALPSNSSVSWNIPSGITYTVSPTAPGCIVVTSWGSYSSTGTTISATVTDQYGCQSTGSLAIQYCCQSSLYPNYVDAQTQTILSANPNAFNGTKFYVNGTLTVNTNTTFKECKIFFGPHAKVVIDNGRTLTILSQNQTSNCYAHLKAGCNDMWNGITIKPQGQLVTNTANNNGVLIEDADTAVTSVGGGSFNIKGTWFNKNYHGVVVMPFSGTHPGQIAKSVFTCRNLNNSLSGCPPVFSSSANTGSFLTGLSTATLLAPYNGSRSTCGVDAILVNNITVGLASGSNNTNIFDNHDIGVKSSASNMTVVNNRFQNITGPTLQLMQACPIGTAVCATGITLFNAFKTITVGGLTPPQGNTFVNCSAGVLASVNLNVTVTRNQFNSISSSGISVVGCGNRTIDISRNNITDAFNAIYVYNSPRSTTSISRNTITLVNTMSNNNARGIWVQDVSPVPGGSTTLFQNNVSEMRFGVRLVNKYAPQVINNSVLVKNITSPTNFGSGILLQNCTGGAFVQSNHISGYSTATCPLDANCSPSYSCNNGVWWTNGIRIDMSDFTSVQCNDVQNCGDGLFAGGSMPTTQFRKNDMNGNLFRAFIGNYVLLPSQGSITAASDNYWNPSGTFAYNSYTLNPLAPSSVTTNCFRVQGISGYNPGGTGECSNFNSIFYAFQFPTTNAPSNISCPAFKLHGNINLAKRIAKDSISFNGDTLSGRVLSKLAIYNAIKVDTTLAADTLLISFRDSLRNTPIGVIDSVYSSMTIPMTNVEAANALALNASATVTDSITYWHKEVNAVALNNIAVRQSSYSPGELTKLRFVASQCPYKFGPSVYEARAILAEVDPFITEYWNECEIPTPPTFSARLGNTGDKPASTTVLGKLYPNPSSGDFFYEYELEEGITGNITIFNVMGEAVSSHDLPAGKNLVKISSGNLAAGMYLAKIRLSDGESYTERIIINK